MRYFAYDLVIETPFSCPGLLQAPGTAEPDVIVVEGDVPLHLDIAVVDGKNWQAAPNSFLYRGGSRVGRFLVEGGRQVIYRRSPAAEDALVAFHFLDIILAAVLRQRGLLVLHANAAVHPNGMAVAVTGESGAGKSTTLAALLQNGCTMLSDDITALRLGADGTVAALPGIPQFHLTDDSARGLGRDLSGLPRFSWRQVKAAVPVSTAMADAPAKLESLYWVEVCAVDDLRVTVLQGTEKFAALQNFIYGPLLPQSHPDLFPLFAAVVENVTLYQVQRPADRWTIDKIVALLLENGLPV
ncbi:MAG: hypothetical protein ACOYYS_07980 [Chloroflexota bacterium]